MGLEPRGGGWGTWGAAGGGCGAEGGYVGGLWGSCGAGGALRGRLWGWRGVCGAPPRCLAPVATNKPAAEQQWLRYGGMWGRMGGSMGQEGVSVGCRVVPRGQGDPYRAGWGLSGVQSGPYRAEGVPMWRDWVSMGQGSLYGSQSMSEGLGLTLGGPGPTLGGPGGCPPSLPTDGAGGSAAAGEGPGTHGGGVYG